MTFQSNYPKPGASLVAGAVLSATLVASGTTLASSHREAPFITEMPKVDATDFYLFNSYEASRENYVTLIANYQPLQDAYGGPNYFTLDSDAIYEVHIDNDGDAVEDLTFQFTFESRQPGADTGVELTIGDQQVAVPLKAVGAINAQSTAGANFSESFQLNLIRGDRRLGTMTPVTDAVSGADTFAKPLDYFGEKTFGGADSYAGYVASLTNSGDIYHDIVLSDCPAGSENARVFVGQRKESFSVNLGRIFDLINLDPINGVDDVGNNDLEDKNITTLALEIHKDCLVGNGNGVIGGWTTASKRQFQVFNPEATRQQPTLSGGAYTQISRLGNPLVNEVVIGLPDKNRFNSSEPADDGQFATYVTHPTLPAIINLVFNSDGALSPDSIAPTNLPRGDLVAAFLTGVEGVTQMSTVTPSEMLRLNTAIAATVRESQSNLGVAAGDLAGFPNGRRPGDDVVDLALRAMMGAFCHEIAVDLNADQSLDENDNLLLCGEDVTSSKLAAPVGMVGFTDGAPQNAMQFDVAFPYLTTPIPGAGS
ncbi:MAG: DUF4331 domain-containing protein [Gammaproteobacteria bacterium]|nr:DUF4331 domain-containing protein [Gammaproteobacteria bacterium]